MRLKLLLLWATLVLLGGCASPTAKLNQPPVDIVWEDLPKYWVQVEQIGDFNPVGGLPKERPVKGCVTLRYLIDSNGDLFSPEVLSSEPPGVLDLIAISGLAQVRYRVSEQNPQAIPVRVVVRYDVEVR
ncbi:energy transducer TonB [Aeromonas media]|uniref:Energy transducer TonB n=1 Tax=Aeromonas media TaxID=651 RepID=A0AAW5RNM9_AERME|nr:energy transducer TonB [Aeromonas media]MBS4638816.1 energy transducer TonB [Aeromonas media]MCV3288284.1 energy transducer TonB [Aeromonas media]QYK79764.1 energy transducer TonB [Aeromonas media]